MGRKKKYPEVFDEEYLKTLEEFHTIQEWYNNLPLSLKTRKSLQKNLAKDSATIRNNISNHVALTIKKGKNK